MEVDFASILVELAPLSDKAKATFAKRFLYNQDAQLLETIKKYCEEGIASHYAFKLRSVNVTSPNQIQSQIDYYNQ